MERMCSMCRQVKDINEFSTQNKKQYDKIYVYLRSYCKNCQRIYNKEYMRAYREIHPEYVEKNRIKNKEKHQKRIMEEENYNHIPRVD